MNVKDLRKAGYLVRVTHYRRYWILDRAGINASIKLLAKDEGPGLRFCLSKGGQTVIEVTTPNGNNFVGVAFCMCTDSYNKKEGVKYALKNLLTRLQVDTDGIHNQNLSDGEVDVSIPGLYI